MSRQGLILAIHFIACYGTDSEDSTGKAIGLIELILSANELSFPTEPPGLEGVDFLICGLAPMQREIEHDIINLFPFFLFVADHIGIESSSRRAIVELAHRVFGKEVEFREGSELRRSIPLGFRAEDILIKYKPPTGQSEDPFPKLLNEFSCPIPKDIVPLKDASPKEIERVVSKMTGHFRKFPLVPFGESEWLVDSKSLVRKLLTWLKYKKSSADEPTFEAFGKACELFVIDFLEESRTTFTKQEENKSGPEGHFSVNDILFPFEVKSVEIDVSGLPSEAVKIKERFRKECMSRNENETENKGLYQLYEWLKKNRGMASNKIVCPLLIVTFEEARRSPFQRMISEEWRSLDKFGIDCLPPLLMTVSELLDFFPRLKEKKFISEVRAYIDSDDDKLHTFFTSTQDLYRGRTSDYARMKCREWFPRLSSP